MEELSNLFNKMPISTFDVNQIEAEEEISSEFTESETRRRKPLPVLQVQVTDDLQDIPRGMISCFDSNNSNP